MSCTKAIAKNKYPVSKVFGNDGTAMAEAISLDTFYFEIA
jgi:hypothetical protein